MSVSLKELLATTEQLLKPKQFKDYCPNGLQVEGRLEVKRIVTGVTACLPLLEAAKQLEADAVLVHHGYFWQGEADCLKGMKKQRIKYLLDHDLSLIAYHLPLDAHDLLGNNAQLGKLLNLHWERGLETGNKRSIAVAGRLQTPMLATDFADLIEQKLSRRPVHIPAKKAVIESIGWCTGAAQSYFPLAVEQGLDAYLTGEISEQSVHMARETDTHFYAAGHHATERYGVQALGNYLQEALGVEHYFIDINNPI